MNRFGIDPFEFVILAVFIFLIGLLIRAQIQPCVRYERGMVCEGTQYRQTCFERNVCVERGDP